MVFHPDEMNGLSISEDRLASDFYIEAHNHPAESFQQIPDRVLGNSNLTRYPDHVQETFKSRFEDAHKEMKER